MELFLNNKEVENRPDIICLQETGGIAKMTCYKAFGPLNGIKKHGKETVTTLVRRNIPTLQHDTGIETTEHAFIELIPGRKKKTSSLFILNLYSSPREKNGFTKLLQRATKIADKSPLIIVGDFNAHHAEWGYDRDSKRGRTLWTDAQNLGLTLQTDSSFPTRTGNSVSKDTTPDLTFTKNVREKFVWANLHENLGSDHYIVQSTLETGPPQKRKGKEIRITEWDKFREIRHARKEAQGEHCAEIEDIQEWIEQLQEDARVATKTIPQEADLQQADARLLHMWEAKNSLHKRLGSQKHNRTLRKKIAMINKQIEEHANQLSRQNWHDMCNRMDSQMSLAKTWNIFRHLINPEGGKTAQGENLKKIIHLYEGTEEDLIKDIQQKYFGGTNQLKSHNGKYEGTPNPTLDKPISESEVRAAIQELKPKSAPGPDGITNKIIRNMDDASIEALTKYFNQVWNEGQLPKTWKTANIVMIPKPGKKLHLNNLRPISLTSCLGKLLEHIILNRLNKHMELNGLYPDTMIGFRTNLSTQDVLLQLKQAIIYGEGTSILDTRALLGLDIAKAFDRISHEAILNSIEKLGLGEKTFNYVANFLNNRTAKLKIGEIESKEFDMVNRGTPQGSVLSPFLFNVGMIGLPEELNKIKNLNHTIYADDLALWVAGGSDGDIQNTLQEAIHRVEEFLSSRGLECSPEKSELLVKKYRKSTKETPREHELITLILQKRPIPKVNTIKILGLRIQENDSNTEAVRALEGNVNQVLRLISRVTNRHNGLKEGNIIRLIQAYIISRIAYLTPFLKLKTEEKTKVNNLIKRAYKRAIGIPISTPNEKLEALGLHNTLDEIIEAQKLAQHERLSRSKTGRYILDKLNIRTRIQQEGPKKEMDTRIRETFVTASIPRNMHPSYNQERREERARALHKKYGKLEDTLYTDTALQQGPKRKSMICVVVDNTGSIVTACTVLTNFPQVGEEAAIALAMATGKAKRIISDSKTAILNFSRGYISTVAYNIIRETKREPGTKTALIWTPAHSGMPGNEFAHEAARDLIYRAPQSPADALPDETEDARDPLTTYREILYHYRCSRKKYPEAHGNLSRSQAIAWRQIQTGTFPNPLLYSYYYPGTVSDLCKACGTRADLKHIIWACAEKQNDTRRINIFNEEQWEAALLSSEEQLQLLLIQEAEEAARGQGLLADD